MNEVTRGKWAAAYLNAGLVCVETWSGYRGGERRDYKGKIHRLDASVSDENLGLAIIDSLEHSRWLLGSPREGFVPPPGLEFDMEQYDYKLVAEKNVQWINDLMKHYGYKTKRALFKGLLRCGIELKNGTIKITPMRRSGAEGWEDLGEDNEGVVEIPAESLSADIGAALRVAFSRCAD